MKKIVILAFILLVVLSEQTNAQSLQSYTPSVLLNKGQNELKVFNNLYTQTSSRDENGNSIQLGRRESFLNNQFRWLHGISQSKRINIGLEVNITTAKFGEDGSSVFNVLDGGEGTKKSLISSFGPSIKLVPFSQIGNFSIQSTFLIPTFRDNLETGGIFVNHNRYTWFTQFFYDRSITSKWNLFMEADILARFKVEDEQKNFYRLPLNLILSHFLTDKITLYTNAQHAAVYGNHEQFTDEPFGRLRWYTQLGVGGKYLFSNGFEVEASYSNFILSRNDGAGHSINLGIRILK